MESIATPPEIGQVDAPVETGRHNREDSGMDNLTLVDATPETSSVIGLFVRRNAVRICFGTVLVFLASLMISLTLPYLREVRTAESIRSLGGEIHFGQYGPHWIPHTLQLKLLVYSRINQVHLKGAAVSEAALAEIHKLEHIEGIRLSEFDAISLLPLKGSDSLLWLDINDCREVTGLEQLHGLKGLDLTNVGNTAALLEAGALDAMTGLVELEVGNTLAWGGVVVENRQNYSSLSDSGMQHLARFKKLVGVDLSGTNVTSEGLRNLKELPCLTHLSLVCTAVDDDAVESLKRITTLEMLDIRRTQVTDAGAVHLKGLVNLRSLELPHEGTSLEMRDELRQALPKCTITAGPPAIP